MSALRKREKTGCGASARNAKRARAPGTLNLDVGSRISQAQTLKTFLLVSERLRKAGKKSKKYGEFAESFRTAYCTLLADKELAEWCPQEATARQCTSGLPRMGSCGTCVTACFSSSGLFLFTPFSCSMQHPERPYCPLRQEGKQKTRTQSQRW